jgi:hypothetical protein
VPVPEYAEEVKEALIKECGSNAQRIRVVNRTLYTDHNFGRDELDIPKMFAEMLVTAVWLYEDFPDVELFVWHEDAPGACHLRVPFLLTSFIKPEVAQGNGIEGSVGGIPVAIGPLYGAASPTADRVPYTKGYAVPIWEQWLGLGMLPAQLHATQHLRYLQALDKQPFLQPQAVWRGSMSGGIKGWPAPHKPSEWPYKDPWAPLMLNKRLYVARVARTRPELFDVGVVQPPSGGEDMEVCSKLQQQQQQQQQKQQQQQQESLCSSSKHLQQSSVTTQQQQALQGRRGQLCKRYSHTPPLAIQQNDRHLFLKLFTACLRCRGKC